METSSTCCCADWRVSVDLCCNLHVQYSTCIHACLLTWHTDPQLKSCLKSDPEVTADGGDAMTCFAHNQVMTDAADSATGKAAWGSLQRQVK